MSTNAPSFPDPAVLLPYQGRLVEYLRTEHPDLWKWFSSAQIREQQADSVRLDLLKTTYRIDAGANPGLYDLAGDVRTRLGVAAPVTFYQSQITSELNAGLAYVPGEAHVIFYGPLLDMLEADELRAAIAHEITHFALYERSDHEILVADQILSAMSHDAAADASHTASLRLLGLYNEISCDRGAYLASDDVGVAVSTLVKMETGLKHVSASSYIRQADEIFSRAEVKTDGLTHPECFIRARAVALWVGSRAGADGEIERMIEGSPRLEELDLLGRRQVESLTRRVVDALLAPAWLRTERVCAHARLFFDDWEPAAGGKAGDGHEEIARGVARLDASLKTYLAYVILDFVTADRGLEDLPLAAALRFSRQIGLQRPFEEIAPRELGLGRKRFQGIRSNVDALLAGVDERAGTS